MDHFQNGKHCPIISFWVCLENLVLDEYYVACIIIIH